MTLLKRAAQHSGTACGRPLFTDHALPALIWLLLKSLLFAFENITAILAEIQSFEEL